MIFRALVRTYLYYEKVSFKIDPRKLYNCPTECAKGVDLKRRNFCDDCETKKQADKLRNATLSAWREKIGIRAKQFIFDDVLKLLYSVMSMENASPEKLSVKTAALLGVYLSEVNRRKRIELWDAEKESN